MSSQYSGLDLPDSVQQILPDPAKSLFALAFNSSLASGKSELLSFVKGYQAVEQNGYELVDGKYVRKDSPTLSDVHVNAPLGSRKKKPKKTGQAIGVKGLWEDKDDPGTQDVDTLPLQKSFYWSLVYKAGPSIDGDELLCSESVVAKADLVTVDVPLFLRLLELAHEDIKSDEALHALTEKVTELLEDKDSLGMDDYKAIVEDLQKRARRKKGGKKDDPGTQDVDPPTPDPYFSIPPVQGPREDQIVTKRISGNSDIPLNAEGERMARQLGKRLALRGGLDVLYSSPLKRAVQTAAAIAAAAPKGMKLAGPVDALRPWRLGSCEGKKPKECKDLIRHYVEHPDQVPPGTGADGKPAESLDTAIQRQLTFLCNQYKDWAEQDPTYKIGDVMHSRGMQLLRAYVGAGCPEDFNDLDSDDITAPDDSDTHADVLRWHKGEIKEIDLDDDDPLKPGIYLILHSLTDDDTDEGNKELRKGAPPHLRETTGTERCANCKHYDPAGHCTLYDNYPVEANQVCDSWTAKAKVEKYQPPVEVRAAAQSAYNSGMAVLDITAPLAEGEGLAIAEVQKIAAYFAALPNDPVATQNAWGGKQAQAWAARVIKKHGTEWPAWEGIDLDGTLAEQLESYDGTAIGAPVEKTVNYVKDLLKKGVTVKIFTARIADDPTGKVKSAIEAWCEKNLGQKLPVTNEKDPGMVKLVDDRSARPEEVAKQGNGVMIAFWPDAATQKRIAVAGGEPADSLHITLAYLGKRDEFDMNMLPSIEHSLRVFADTQPPVSGTLGGIGRFPATPNSDNKDVVYMGFHSDEIQDFRQKMMDCIEQAGARPRKNFGYTPHLTLKYVSPHAPHLLNTPEHVPVTFDKIVLSIGSERKEFPLTGMPLSKGEFEFTGMITKVDKDRHLVFGFFSVVSIEGVPVTDTQGDQITEATIEDAAYQFTLNSRTGGEMHTTDGAGDVVGVGRLVESVVFTLEKQAAMVGCLHDQGISAVLDLHCVAWWGGFYIESQAVWDRITTGQLRGFSIGGKGKRAKIAA